MKKTNTYEHLTMQEARALLNEKIDTWNASTDFAEQVALKVEIKNLIQKCNLLSMLGVYANCLTDEQPLVAFAKAYQYDVISLKEAVCTEVDADGKPNAYNVLSIKEVDKDGNKLRKTLDLVKFIEWSEDRNKCVAYNKDWRKAFFDGRNAINDECKEQMNSKDGYKISKNKVKNAMQNVFDALAFIESKTGKNAIVATGKLVAPIIHLAADLNVTIANCEPNFVVEFLKADKWNKLVFDFLNMAVRGKTYDVVYGDPEPKDDTEAKKDKPEATK